MRYCVSALLLALALLFARANLAAGPGLPLDPRVTPALPAEPPPLIPQRPAVTAPGTSATVSETVTVTAGWSIVSLPYASLRRVEGLSRMLLRLDQCGFTPVDPVHHPESLAPGLAYLAWAPQPEEMQVQGVPGPPGSTRLHPGWNLLGNPTSQPLIVGNFTVTRPGGVTRLMSETADPSISPGAAWLFSVAGAIGQSGRGRLDLRTPKATWEPGGVAWFFAWTDLDWNWNATSPLQPPVISAVKPGAAAPGESVRVSGQGFGERGQGGVTVGGVAIPSSAIAAWSDREVLFTLPAGARAGRLVVMKDRFPSGGVAFQVRAQAPAAHAAPAATKAAPAAGRPAAAPARAPVASSGTLEGRVLDTGGKPLPGSLVALENGQEAVSRDDGVFSIRNVPVGRHFTYVSHVGYRTGSGEVTIAGGKTRSLGVKLSPVGTAPAPPPEKSTTLTIKAWAFTASGSRVWPKKILVWESGNSGRSWTETWWEDRGDPYQEFRCPGVLVGRSYVVLILWNHASGRERQGRWEPRIWKQDQTESYERPN